MSDTQKSIAISGAVAAVITVITNGLMATYGASNPYVVIAVNVLGQLALYFTKSPKQVK